MEASRNQVRTSEADRLVAELRQVRLFAPLDDAALGALAARAVPRALARRAPLFRKGEPCRGLHVVLEGRVEIYAAARDGREQVLHRIGPRQAVTELPLFDGATYPASARAQTDARVLFLPAEVVERLCDEHPELLRVVIGDLGRSIRRLTQLVEKVSLKDVRARVATALLEQAGSQGALRDGGRFALAGTQEQLAHALGVTRESVARALASLRRAGVIEQQGRRIRLAALHALAAIADGADGANGAHGAHGVDGAADAPARSPVGRPSLALLDGGAGGRRDRQLAAYRVALDGPCC